MGDTPISLKISDYVNSCTYSYTRPHIFVNTSKDRIILKNFKDFCKIRNEIYENLKDKTSEAHATRLNFNFSNEKSGPFRLVMTQILI